jgi:hypothetical protein
MEELGRDLVVTMTPLNNDVQYRAEQSHHWYDTIYSILATLVAYLKGCSDVEAFKKEHEVQELTPGTHKLVQRGKRVGPSAVTEFKTVLKGLEGRDFAMIQAFLDPSASASLLVEGTAEKIRDKVAKFVGKELPEGGLVFLPLIVGHGLLESEHIVWVTADLKEKRIAYFDPKGNELETDDNGKVVVDKDNKHRLVAGAIAALMETTEIETVVQNPVRLQYDIHGCGIHGMKLMTILTREGMTFEKYIMGGEVNIAANRVSMAEAIVSLPQQEEVNIGEFDF